MPESRSWEQLRGAAVEAVIAVLGLPPGLSEKVTDAVLGVLDEEALNRLCESYVEASRLRSIRAEDGDAVLEMEAAREAAVGWVLTARTLLQDATNYSETSMEFQDRPRGERYAFTVQRVGKLTPHEARMQAEARLAAVRNWARLLRQPRRGELLRLIDGDTGQ